MASKAELALILSLIDEVSKTARGIKGELLDVGKTGQGLQGTLRDVGKGLASLGTTLIVGGIATATAAVTGLGVAMGKLALDALPLEGVRDAFQGISDDSDVMLAALREGSLGMVRDTELMKSYNLAAQLVGKTFADELPSAMGYLTKVAAATGQDMGYMMDSLVRGVGRLSPMILDNLGIQVDLTKAYEDYAATLGKSSDELTKAEQQAALMAQVMDLLAENTAAMPEVAGTARQRWAALGVTFKNIKDDIGLALIPALEAIMKPIAELVEKHGPALVELFEQKIAPAIETIAMGVRDFIGGLDNLARGDINGFLEGLWNLLYSIGEAFGIAEEDMRPFLEGITDATESILTFIRDALIPFVQQHAEEFKAALIAIGAVLAGAAIVSGLVAIAGALNPVTLGIMAVMAVAALLGAAWAGNWGGIQEKTQAVIGFIQPLIESALTAIQGWWAANGEQIMATVSSLWETVQNAFSTAVTFISGVIQAGLDFIRGFWEQNGADIMTIVDWLWATVQAVFSTAAATIQGIIATVTAVIQRLWEQHGATITALLQNVWDSIKAIFQIALNIIQGIIKAVAAAIRGDWEGFGKALRGIIDQNWEQIKRIFGNAAENIRTIVRNLVDSVKRFFTEVDWGGIGRSIIDGVANGVRGAAGFLADAARSAAQAALDAAKGFLGIHSPSSVAAEMIGRPFVEGIGVGIDRAMRELAHVQIPTVMAPMVPATAGALGARSTAEATVTPGYGAPVYQFNFYGPVLATEEQLIETLTPAVREINRREGRR